MKELDDLIKRISWLEQHHDPHGFIALRQAVKELARKVEADKAASPRIEVTKGEKNGQKQCD